MLSLGTRLSNAKQHRVHVSDMEPMVAALFWNRMEREARETIRECRSMPSEYGALAEAAETEADYARARRHSILTSLWLERLARNHTPQLTERHSRNTSMETVA